MVPDDPSKPRSRQCGASLQVWLIPADFGKYADITLQDTLHPDHMLRLFIDNQELGLHADTRQPNLDTSQTPVCPLFSHYARSPIAVHV